MTKLTYRSWRTWLGATFLALALLALPSSAAASIAPSPDIIYEFYDCNGGRRTLIACPSQTLAGPRYVGWTYLNNNYCPAGMACVQGGPSGYLNLPAWRWSGTAWSRASLSQGWVYVYPYSGQWRWAWTQQTGWLAVTGGRFEVRQY